MTSSLQLPSPTWRDDPQGATPLVMPIGAVMTGESVAEAVMRATSLNSYRRTTHVLAAAGFEVGRHSVRIGNLSNGLEGLAVALGLPSDSEDLQRAAIRPLEGKPGWVDFFGIPLRAIHRDARRRRVSPMSLRNSLHLKAIWSVGVFSFDPRTKETLLSRCPECSRQPTFDRTYGLQYCEFCVSADRYGVTRGRVDFRDHPQPTVEISDLEALDFCSDLVDPERSNDNWRRSLHPEIGALQQSSLFEGIFAVACALTSRPSHISSTLERPSYLEDYQRFTPEVLARSARMFLDWPDGFHRVAEDIRATAEDRRGYYGVRKELGPLVAISMDELVDPHLKSLFKRMIAIDMGRCDGAAHAIRTATYRATADFVPVHQAAKDFHLDSRTVLRLVRSGALPCRRLETARKGPTLVDVAALKNIVAHREQNLTASKVAIELCVPRACLPALADMGLLTSARSILSAPYAMDYYEKGSVGDLRRRCEDAALRTPAPATALSIVQAVGRLRPKPSNPWPEIIHRIIRGQLEVWNVGRKSLMASMAVRDAGALRFLDATVPGRLDSDIVLTQCDAAGVLRTTPVIVNQLVREGFLPKKPTVRELDAFLGKFILTSEITECFAILGRPLRWRDVPRLLRAAGVRPHVLEPKKTLVWQRKEVEPLLKAA